MLTKVSIHDKIPAAGSQNKECFAQFYIVDTSLRWHDGIFKLGQEFCGMDIVKYVSICSNEHLYVTQGKYIIK